jgi:hypothetical protein
VVRLRSRRIWDARILNPLRLQREARMPGRLRERLGEARKHAEQKDTEAAYDAVRAQQLRTESTRSMDDNLRARVRAASRPERQRKTE